MHNEFRHDGTASLPGATNTRAEASTHQTSNARTATR